jgi:type VI secretion system protein ImpE
VRGWRSTPPAPTCGFRSITFLVRIEQPQRLRDTLWTPADVLTGPSFKGTDIGQVIIPAVYPYTWKSENEALWLGRSTEWAKDDDGHEFPVGQKTFIVDGEEVPLLEIRSLEFASNATS